MVKKPSKLYGILEYDSLVGIAFVGGEPLEDQDNRVPRHPKSSLFTSYILACPRLKLMLVRRSSYFCEFGIAILPSTCHILDNLSCCYQHQH
jgi:hypothetical protein